MSHVHRSPSRASRRAGSFLLLALTLMTLQLSAAVPRAQAANNNIVISTLTFNNNLTGGVITGILAGSPFTTTFTSILTPGDNPNTPNVVECAVLDLHLAPIHLNVLGLHVDTSDICLQINAIPGGGLLGDLLCNLAGGLNINVASLQSALVDLLNQALNSREANPGGGGSVCTGSCVVLDLVLGPLDLNLLGLEVILDNCSGGAIEICVSATANQGLLGQLLCGLTSAQLRHLSLADITQLVTTALAALADGVLSPTEAAALRALLFQLALR